VKSRSTRPLSAGVTLLAEHLFELVDETLGERMVDRLARRALANSSSSSRCRAVRLRGVSTFTLIN